MTPITNAIPRLRHAQHLLLRLVAGLMLALAAALPLVAAERERVEDFLAVTGFDVALDSLAQAAGNAPAMLGLDEGSFGADWDHLAQEVFDTATMRELALELLEPTLDDGPLDHAIGFYGGDLGKRLVEAENRAHMRGNDPADEAEGEHVLQQLEREDAERVGILARMNDAIDGSGTSLRALQEIQIRFMLAARDSGVIELPMDEGGLRALMEEQAGELGAVLERSALANAARTYAEFPDTDLRAYAEALEEPEMQEVYRLLNAVQFEILANRFEVLAGRMADHRPQQDI